MKLRLAILICFVLVSSSSAQVQSIGSCKIFPSNNPWNTRVDSLPVHPNSAKFIATVGGSVHVHPDFGSNAGYGIPWEPVGSSVPFVPIDLSQGYVDQSDPGPMPILPTARVEGGGVGDAHVLIVDTANHHLYELYQGKKVGNGWQAQASAIYALDSNNYRPDGWTSCDAAGLPIFPGLVRMDECQAGEIKHALRFTVQKSSKGWIFPARHEAGSTSDTTNVMPMGLRMRLKASFDDSKDTGFAKVIITAMKRYGIIMADNGSNWFISGEMDTSWHDNDINQLKAISGNDFEAVYTGPIRIRPNQFPDPVFPIPTSSQLSVSKSSLDFGSVNVQSTGYDTVTLSNAGSTVIDIVNSSIQSSPGTAFAMIGHPTSVPASGSVRLPISFTPDRMGSFTGTLKISTNEAGNPQYTVSLAGLGTAGVFHIAANPFLFGNVEVGQTGTSNFSMSNAGNAALTVKLNNPNANPDFNLVSIDPPQPPPLNVDPGGVVTATVSFTPVKVGSDTVSYDLTVTDYEGHDFDTLVMLIGDGIPSSSVATDRAQSLDWTIFPNPAINALTIASNDASTSGSVDVIDALGRSVLKGNLKAGNATLDVSTIPNGTYFVRLITAAGATTKTINVLH